MIQVVTEHPTVQFVRTSMDAFLKGDFEAVRRSWSPDVVWHVPGMSDLAGEKHGPDAIFTYLDTLFDRSNRTLQPFVYDVIGNERHVAVLVRHRAQRGSRVIDGQSVFLITVRDGLVDEVVEFQHEQDRWDTFWSDRQVRVSG